MNKIEIVGGSLQISKDGIIILVMPKDACAIDTLALKQDISYASIFNKYLANFTPLFNKPLDSCIDRNDVVFTQSSFITFAESSLGF